MQATTVRRIPDRSMQALVECVGKARRLVHLVERRVDRFPRHVAVDAADGKLLKDSPRSSCRESNGGAGVCEGGSPVIQRAGLLQSGHRLVDVGGGDPALAKTLAELLLGQFLAVEPGQSERVGIGRGARGHSRGQKRMISEEPSFDIDWEISSCARSLVVEMPWTLILNSSTFVAQRKASS